MSRLSNWIMRVASWRTVLAAFLLAMVLIAVITNVLIPPIVTATGGLDPFDITFPLSAEDILSGLDVTTLKRNRPIWCSPLSTLSFRFPADFFRL